MALALLAEPLHLMVPWLCCCPGVELRGGEALECELLVDASGRSSKLPECLAAQGRPLAGLRRDVVNSGLCYTTRTLAMPPNWVREKVRACCRSRHLSHVCCPV